MDSPSGISSPEMTWNPEDDKLYEDYVLKRFPGEDENRWEKFASGVPGKSTDDIKAHFEALIAEANTDPIYNPIDNEISSGQIETLIHSDDCSEFSSASSHWTEEEHRNWSSISRNYYKHHKFNDQPPLTSVASIDGGAMDPLPTKLPSQKNF